MEKMERRDARRRSKKNISKLERQRVTLLRKGVVKVVNGGWIEAEMSEKALFP